MSNINNLTEIRTEKLFHFYRKTGYKTCWQCFRMRRPRKVDPFIFYYYFTDAISLASESRRQIS